MTAIANKRFYQEYVYDFAKDGGATGAIDLSAKAGVDPLPVGAVITSVHRHTITALTSGGSATVALGTAGSAAEFLAATAFDNAAFDANVAKVAAIGVPKLVTTVAGGKFQMTIAAAALTAGKIVFAVEGFVPAATALN